MKSDGLACEIHIAFRFNVNLYHSYRGDSADESGIGKDIRIITGILDTLDRLNREGMAVRGTWGLDNYYTLEKILPEHCPEILERIRGRVNSGTDEVEYMSWNNGMCSAHTAEEMELVLNSMESNAGGSGFSDLFARAAPVMRPQDCMYTPSFLKILPEKGIRCLSLYYSSHPFNGFSNFVPALSLAERHNPLMLKAPGFDESMLLMPCYNHGDIADHISLRSWLRDLRQQQVESEAPTDLLLLIDMDADDEFWTGYGRTAGFINPSAYGLDGLIKSTVDLPFLRYTTPWDYIKNRTPAGTVSFGQDTADGRFDGYSSWTEKWSSVRLWTGIQRSRLMEQWCRTLEKDIRDTDVLDSWREKAEGILYERTLAQATSHFGMAAPVMNKERLIQAADRVVSTVELSRLALSSLLCSSEGDSRVVFPDRSAWFTPLEIPVPVREGKISWKLMNGPEDPVDEAGRDRMPASMRPVRSVRGGMENGILDFRISDDMPQIRYRGKDVFRMENVRSGVIYGGRDLCFRSNSLTRPERFPDGSCRMEWSREAKLPGGETVQWSGHFFMWPEMPYVLCDIHVEYPQTKDRGYSRKKSRLLNRTWDARWREIRPFELALNLEGSPEYPLRVWKRNFFNDVSWYDLPGFSADSMNNHITNGWIGLTGGNRGLMTGTTCAAETSPAFCPLRIVRKRRDGKVRVHMNPLGTYHGKQWKYPAAKTGAGRTLALMKADHLDSPAPSYNGKNQHIVLLLAPFEGQKPPEDLTVLMSRFASPPLIQEDPVAVGSMTHWRL